MANLTRFSELQPFIVCLFCGKKKPDNLFDYLNEFLTEFRLLKISGIEHNGKVLPVSIKAFVCDAPARSFLKYIKGHGGYHSCKRCLVDGEYDGRVVFTEVDHQMQSDEQFKEYVYLNHSVGTNNVCCEPHQLGRTPLVDYGILCVKEFVIDYMHCVCLGVMKRLIKYWFEGPRICRLSCQQKKQMSDKLAFYHNKMPSEFARQPRSLDEFKHFKATEFQQFLLYTGPIILKNILSKEVYQNFLCLSIAVFLMSNSNVLKQQHYLDYAKKFIAFFVLNLQGLYGPQFYSYNVHALLHLHEDVLYHNCSLHDLSSFPFENFLQIVKKFVKSENKPLIQLAKRLSELKSSNVCYGTKISDKIVPNDRNGWFILKSLEIVRIIEIVSESQFDCNVIPFCAIDNLFTIPCYSSDFGIYKISKFNKMKRKCITLSDICYKLICLEQDDDFILIEVNHEILY